jgi:anti-sigma regulatory factor (Ser/Thr protein kinase)
MEDISLHLLDIAENAINAGATLVQIKIEENIGENIFSVTIEDNGRGIPTERLAEVLDPFYTTRTTRKIGLGLPLLAQSARETGGDISIQSSEGKGTVVNAFFRPSHIDMRPVGNIADTLIVLITGNPHVDFVFAWRRDDREYSLDTRQIKAELDGMPITSPDVVSVIRNYLVEILADTRKEKDVQ